LDTIWGDYGSDWIYGGRDRDKLMGGNDYDYLFGEHGDDWLDAGSAGEYVDGGSNGDGTRERDVNAWVTTVGSAEYLDIDQMAGPTCWILASMAAVSRYDYLSNRITY